MTEVTSKKAYRILYWFSAFSISFIYISTTLGFLYYALINESEGSWSCYATQDESMVTPCRDPNDSECPATSEDNPYHDVSANFQMVCIWGFINYTLIAFAYFAPCIKEQPNQVYFGLILLFLLITFASWLSQSLTMYVMRYRHAGVVCSGGLVEDPSLFKLLATPQEPYLLRTGSFLHYVLWSTLVIFIAIPNGYAIPTATKEAKIKRF